MQPFLVVLEKCILVVRVSVVRKSEWCILAYCWLDYFND